MARGGIVFQASEQEKHCATSHRPPIECGLAVRKIGKAVHYCRNRCVTGKAPQEQLTDVSAPLWNDTDELLAVHVRLDTVPTRRSRATIAGRDSVRALEAVVEDFLRLDADVDADGDGNGEQQQRAAQQRVREHVENMLESEKDGDGRI